MEIRILRKQSPCLTVNLRLPSSTKPADRQEITASKMPGQGGKANSYFTHLELKKAPFLFHFLCDLGSSYFCADHPVLFCMLSLLLLNFCAVIKTGVIILLGTHSCTMSDTHLNAHHGPQVTMAYPCRLPDWIKCAILVVWAVMGRLGMRSVSSAQK